MNAMSALTAQQSPPRQLPSVAAINEVQITGAMLVDAFAHAHGPCATTRTSLERFAAQQRLKPPTVAAEALSIRMALLGALMDSCGIVEGEWLATCEAVARIRLEVGVGAGLPWNAGGVSYDAAQLQEMIWAYSDRR